jgi:hypothetical protein
MSSTISAASVSISAITSWITVQTMRFFSRASVVGGGPNALEIGCERGERCRIDGGQDRGGVRGGHFGFDLLRHAGERLFHRAFQFAGHHNRLAGSAASYCPKARSPQWRHPPAARQKRCNAARHCPSSRGCRARDVMLRPRVAGGQFTPASARQRSSPPTKRRRAWAPHGGGWWVRCC